jgi:hypothetical protein
MAEERIEKARQAAREGTPPDAGYGDLTDEEWAEAVALATAEKTERAGA